MQAIPPLQSSPSRRSADPASSVKVDDGCTSDFSCGIGQSCVKAPYSSTGVCMTAVDSSGMKTYKTPSTDSVFMPTSGSCRFKSDCPYGFECDTELKACVKR